MKKIAGYFALMVVVAGAILYYLATKPVGNDVDRALLAAAHANDEAAVTQALSSGANPNAKVESKLWEKWFGEKNYDEGHTALMYAAQWGNTKVIKQLLDKGADVNAANVDGSTPLICAAFHMFPDAVKLLLASGADVTHTTKAGDSVLVLSNKRNVSVRSRTVEQIVARAMNRAGMKVEVPPDLGSGVVM